MPGKKVGRKRGRKHGGSFLSDIWDGIKKVGSFVKDNKLISKGFNLLPDPRMKLIGSAAGALGLGKKRHVGRKHGRGGPVKY